MFIVERAEARLQIGGGDIFFKVCEIKGNPKVTGKFALKPRIIWEFHRTELSGTTVGKY